MLDQSQMKPLRWEVLCNFATICKFDLCVPCKDLCVQNKEFVLFFYDLTLLKMGHLREK